MQRQSQGSDNQEQQQGMVPLRYFFRFTTCSDKLLVILGLFQAFLSGAVTPTISIVMGEILDVFDPTSVDPDLIDEMLKLFYVMIALAVLQFTTGYLFCAFLNQVSENISHELRQQYVDSLLRQEIAYFEKQEVQSLPSLISEYFSTIKNSFGDSLGNIVMTMGTSLSGIIISFVYGPIFALICLAYYPLLIVMGILFGKFSKRAATNMLKEVSTLGGSAEETLSSIKVVTSFNMEHHESEKFAKLSDRARKATISYEGTLSWLYGSLSCLLFTFFGYTFWIGAHAIREKWTNPADDEVYTAKTLLIILIGILMSLTNLVSLGPNVQSLIKSMVIGKKVFDLIDRVPEVRDEEGCQESFVLNRGIFFKDVSFHYPTNRNVHAAANEKANDKEDPANAKGQTKGAPEERWVLRNANFVIKPGQSTVIVGPSGAGKSTIVQLIERFYNLMEGAILFDEMDIRKLTLNSLRTSIGYVSQEPALILGTIKQNMLFSKPDASAEEIREALTMANALFAYDLDPELNSYIGSASITNLSGGQKQRIAIARALMKKPKILILDEATSALDIKSEQEVQKAVESIEQSGHDITIIVIAHRLATIQSARNIIYLQDPHTQVCAEKGTKEYNDIIEIISQQQNIDSDEEQSETDVKKEKEEEKEEEEEEAAEQFGTNRPMNLETLQHPSENAMLKELGPEQVQVEGQKEEKRQVRSVKIREIMAYYKPLPLVIFSVFVSVCAAFVYPIFGYLFTKVLFEIFQLSNDPSRYSDAAFWCGMFLVHSVGYGLSGGLQRISFNVVGQNLIYQIRTKLFREILYKDISWFDSKEHAPGVLTSILSEDMALLTGMTTETLAILFQAYSGLAIGIIIAMYYCWQVSLVCIATSPLMLLGGIMRAKAYSREHKALRGGENKGMQMLDNANALLSDITLNYKTVISFGPNNVNHVVNQYIALMDESRKEGIKSGYITGVAGGYANSVRFFFQGFIFLIAIVFVVNKDVNPDDAYMAVLVLVCAALGCGMQLQMAPNLEKARHAANRIFSVIEEESKIDVRKEDGGKPFENGLIEFKNVSFAYPSKRDRLVLKKVNMVFPVNKKIALVGHSGCGKSTITNLLLRMYDVKSGSITINGVDIRNISLTSLRKDTSIVMQEPQLFNMSIKENILYGNQTATDEQVYNAAKLANALQFIEDNEDDAYDFLSFSQITKTSKNFHETLKSLSQADQEKAQKIVNLTDRPFLKGLLQEVIFQLYNTEEGIQKQPFLQQVKKFDLLSILDLICEVMVQKEQWLGLVMECEWVKESLSLIDQVQDSSIQDSYKELVNLDFLYLNKYAVDDLVIKEWTSSLEVQLVTDNIYSDEEARKSLERLIKNHSSSIQAEWVEKKTKRGFKPQQEGTLHEGFNKMCGLKGSFLSGGQKQRVAIARAIIRDPKILILDEATSALDEKNQSIVQSALDNAMVGRTSIVIAHRLSTIQNCDQIFVFHHGELIEQGTFNELDRDNTSYFYKLKSGLQM